MLAVVAHSCDILLGLCLLRRFTFIIGKGQVIEGWDLGVATMKKGEAAGKQGPFQLGGISDSSA